MGNTTSLRVDWNKKKKKLKQIFAILTEQDLLLIEGLEDEMLVRLQVKMGKSKEDIYKLISGL